MVELTPFEYEHDGVLLKSQIATPAGPGPHPAVLVMHHAIGIGPNELRRTKMLAEAGYVAVAVDMYGTGDRVMGQEEYAGYFGALQQNPDQLRARVVASFEALRNRPDVAADRIGALGFCFGGQCVLELARSGAQAVGVVSFHGLLSTHKPAQPGAVPAKVLVLTGAQDPYAPATDLEALKAELTAAGADWQVTLYGEGFHAFTDPSVGAHGVPGVRYDPFLDRLSWAQATAFLDALLLAD